MNKKNLEFTDFEKELKLKMDELASSVDCFDKISQRAFPNSASDYEDYEDTVSELEYNSSRHKRIRISSLIAAAAAVAVCLFFLAKPDGFVDNVLSNIGGKSDKQIYRSLLAEIRDEVENNPYNIYDLTLEEYIKNDILVNPLYGCPFDDSDKGNLRVRVFVKTCGEIETNQIYAVEYEGDYDNGNFIAAADTKAKFTAEEIADNIRDKEKWNTTTYTSTMLGYAENLFTFGSDGNIVNESGESVSAAGFSYNCIYKSGSEIIPLRTDVLYWHTNGSDAYSYDLRAENVEDYYSKFTSDDLLAIENEWNHMVFYNGSSAAAETELSNFNHVNAFDYFERFEKNDAIEIYPMKLSLNIPNEQSERMGSIVGISENGIDNSHEIAFPTVKIDSAKYSLFYPSTGKNITVTYKNGEKTAQATIKAEKQVDVVLTNSTMAEEEQKILEQTLEIQKKMKVQESE